MLGILIYYLVVNDRRASSVLRQEMEAAYLAD
jgi:hypothetical protein